MELRKVMQDIDYRLIRGGLDHDVQGISYDSRRVKPGDLFICVPGFKTDGHDFAEQAVTKGATAVLAESEISLAQAADLLVTSDCRKAMSIAASNFYDKPSHQVKVIGVTGTNGKTTTTHLIKAILEEDGARVGIMGTLYARMGVTEKTLSNTTPESLDIEEFLNLVQKEKGSYMVMEVSSHALAMGRVDKIRFHAAVFTNLTQDHLDYHQTMDNYKAAKLKLFSNLTRGEGYIAVINNDDPAAGDFVAASGSQPYTYGINADADVRAENLRFNLKGSHFTVDHGGKSFDINMKLIGRFSVYNALAAITFALGAGIKPAVIKQALEKVDGVAGRFEQVDCGQDFTVIIDYAHTPDGLENILRTGQEILENRMITVFGCGGDRDKTKRPLMGKIAAQYSDFCIVTSDNPRSEDPEAIIDDIIPGLVEVENSHYAKIVDRREAIHQAICLAKRGDLVIIAGKGHETYQLVKDKVLDFDDKKVAAEFLRGKIQE